MSEYVPSMAMVGTGDNEEVDRFIGDVLSGIGSCAVRSGRHLLMVIRTEIAMLSYIKNVGAKLVNL